MSVRELREVIPGIPVSEGAGVRLRRSLGQTQRARHDPFLMLDEFNSENAEDYLAGFPDHPHRGFETVTYILEGHMQHEDHLGHRGDLKSGGVQWMTAGRGIIHSEMPQQEQGRLHGFQLWINLPAAEKMKPAGYVDIAAEQIPSVRGDGALVKVIAGERTDGSGSVTGPMRGLSTEPVYFDVALEPGAEFAQGLREGHNAMIYLFEGELAIGAERRPLRQGSLGLLGAQGEVRVVAGAAGARFLLLAGKPLREPVVQYGPFVMNTVEEMEQTLRDYRDGKLV